jgi:polyphosphate glucokinase
LPLTDKFNFRKLYIGGGNVKHLDKEGLPDDVVVVDNMAGLLGGIRLWN